MKALVQRVVTASVTVLPEGGGPGEEVGRIGPGLCVLIGATHDDTADTARRLAAKLAKLRIFSDDEGRMNRSVLDAAIAADREPEMLVVSQFTLYGDAAKGNRPSFVAAARPEVAEPLVEEVVAELERLGVTVATGRFRTDMQVALVNDGPVTIGMEVS